MRQSNIELLRIVSMLMVLLVHADGASLGLPEPSGDVAEMSGRDVWRLGVEALAIIGVNCFTMISGYFGIRLRWRGVASFLLQCMFYALAIYVAVALAGRVPLTLRGVAESLMVLTHTDLWYVPAYFCLMVLSPVLNAGVAGLSRSEFGRVLGLLIAVNLWCGWWWGGRFNPTGYTVMQLVMVYLIGRYVRLYVDVAMLRRRRAAVACAYVAATMAIFCSALYLPSLQAYAYNSPAVLAATVAFFGLFLSVDFSSRAVNYAARSAFAVYLIHKAPPVWGGIMRPAIRSMWAEMSLGEFTMGVIGVCVAFYLLAMAVDPVRRALSGWLLRR